MSKLVKGMVIDAVAKRVGDVRDLVVIDLSRLDAISENQWRLELRKKNIQALTVRNTLARRALSDLGVSGLDQILQGPSTLVYGGQDIVALSKEIVEAAKKNDKIQVKGGAVEGSSLDPAGVEALSKSPSREELISRIAGQIMAPGAKLAAAMLGPGATLASQFKSISEKEGDNSAEAASETE